MFRLSPELSHLVLKKMHALGRPNGEMCLYNIRLL